MNYPSISRTNMRKRGPMESAKLNQHHVQSQYSMEMLYNTLEDLRSGAKAFLSHARDGADEQVKGANQMAAELMHIRKEAAFMKGGIQRA